MILLFQKSLLNCTQIKFDKEFITKEQSSIIVQVSEPGFTQYAAKNIDLANKYIANLVIPDIHLKVGNLLVSFIDVKVANAVFPRPLLHFSKNDQVILGYLKGINMKLTMQFLLKQQVYPYLEDKGEGSFTLQDVDINLNFMGNVSKKCAYHLEVSAENAHMVVRNLIFKLESKLSFLIESMINIFTSEIIRIFNEEMQNTMYDVFMNLANNLLSNEIQASFPEGEEQAFLTDQRWLHLEMFQDFFEAQMTGQICYSPVWLICESFIDEKLLDRVKYKTNDGFNYFINKNSFRSMLLSLKKQNLFQENCSLNFVHVGVFINCTENQNIFSIVPRIIQYDDKIQIIQFTLKLNKNIIGIGN